MEKIKCPKCGEVFAVDETNYEKIVQQIKNKEFDKEVQRREKNLIEIKDKEIQVLELEQNKKFEEVLNEKKKEMNEKDKRIQELIAKISESQTEKQLAISEMITQKEKEREQALEEKNLVIGEREKTIEQLKGEIKNYNNQKQIEINEVVIQKDAEVSKKNEEIMGLKEKFSIEKSEKERKIQNLEEKISNAEMEKKLAISQEINKKDKEREAEINQKNSIIVDQDKKIEQLRLQIKNFDSEKKLAINEEVSKKNEELNSKKNEISELKAKLLQNDYEKEKIIHEFEGKISSDKKEMELEMAKIIHEKELESNTKFITMKENYDKELKTKDEQIEYYKDFKLRQSTKILGESLEQHCLIQFNSLRMTAFPNAYFEKDNDVHTGSKGDFIFRESKDGMEFISIMFEMKNEMDQTLTKHKNEDFLKELDKDRREKKCEYAVLVSLLEKDNELYNNGIVDVSYKYEKMYIIRPQFFIPIITLLRNAALNSLKYRQELEIIKYQQIDISHFEDNMNTFKEGFARNYRIASDKFKTAMEEIDKTILHLQKIKSALLSSENNLRLANNKAEDLSIKKLTKNAPSVRKQFDELDN